MENEKPSAEVLAVRAQAIARLFKRGRLILIVGIVMVVLYTAVLPIIKNMSPKLHEVYVENEIFYMYNLGFGVLFIVMGILQMLHSKLLAKKNL